MSVPLPPGSSLGRYKILRPLGSGAMGDVYVAEDPSIGRQLAIKTVRLQGASQQEIDERRLRLLREAKAAGRLMHPHAVALFDAGEQDGLVYLAFEFVDGTTLGERMLSDSPIDTLEALRLSREIASALAAAHSQGVIHRDIKPANILLTRNGTAKVADFGIAKMSAQSTELTTAGTVIGSPQYMSPEQIRGELLDGRSDQFSLGTVLYELLTRRRAFMGDTITTLVYLILNEEPDPVEEVRPDLPPRVTELVRRMMDKDREERYESMQAVVDEISQLEELIGETGSLPHPPDLDTAATIATGASTSPERTLASAAALPPTAPQSASSTDAPDSQPTGTGEQASPSRSKKPLILALAAALLVAALAVPIGGFVLWRSFQNAAEPPDQGLTQSETSSASTSASTSTPTPSDEPSGTEPDLPAVQEQNSAEPTAARSAQQEEQVREQLREDADAEQPVTEPSSPVVETASRPRNEPEPRPGRATPRQEVASRDSGQADSAATTRSVPTEGESARRAVAAPEPPPEAMAEAVEPNEQTNAPRPEPRQEDPGWGDLQIDSKVTGGRQLFLEVLPKSVAKEAFLQVRSQGDQRFTHAGRFWEYRDSGYSMPGTGPHLVRLRADGYRDWIVEIDVQPNQAATRLSVTLNR